MNFSKSGPQHWRYDFRLIDNGTSSDLNRKVMVELTVLVLFSTGIQHTMIEMFQIASAGVGRLGLVDYDVVEMSNLHR